MNILFTIRSNSITADLPLILSAINQYVNTHNGGKIHVVLSTGNSSLIKYVKQNSRYYIHTIYKLHSMMDCLSQIVERSGMRYDYVVDLDIEKTIGEIKLEDCEGIKVYSLIGDKVG